MTDDLSAERAMSGKREELDQTLVKTAESMRSDWYMDSRFVAEFRNAILNALMQPSEEMTRAIEEVEDARRRLHRPGIDREDFYAEMREYEALRDSYIHDWQAMIRAIKEETPDREAGGKETGHSGE